jgi:hypothetical protein
MIKVKDNDVRLSAVDARMSPKVFADERPVLFAISPDPGDLLPDVGFPVPHVMLTSVLCMAHATAALARPLGFVVEGELGDWLHEPAVITALRLDERDRHGGPLRSGSALRSA